MARQFTPHAAELARNLRGDGHLAAALRLGAWVLDEVFPEGMTMADAARTAQIAPSTLQRYVAVTELCRRLEQTSFEHLRLSHLKLIVAVDEAAQADLLVQAEDEMWTVAQLRARIAGQRARSAGSVLDRIAAWVADPRRRECELDVPLDVLDRVLADLTWLRERKR
ncbi:MAG: hypothetical protein R3F59_29355 [Myxococcota bacterium]